MNHRGITAAQSLADYLHTHNQTLRGRYVEQLMTECLRLRQGLWDVAKICGADTDGNETPRSFDSDVVVFAIQAATELRADDDMDLATEQAVRGER